MTYTAQNPDDERTEKQQASAKFQSVTSCPECSGQIVLANEQRERICDDCSLVLSEETLDRGLEWHVFDAKERDEKSRVGALVTHLMHDKGLSTTIG